LTTDDISGARAIYNGITFGAPNPFYIVAPVDYSVTGSTLKLSVGGVENTRTTGPSGFLQFEVWAMTGHYANGPPAGSKLVGTLKLQSPLLPGQSLGGGTTNMPFSAPPDGRYYVAPL